MAENGDIVKSKMKDDGVREQRHGWWRKRIAKEFKDWSSLELWIAVFAEFVGTLMLCVWTIGVSLHHENDDPPSLLTNAITAGFFVAVIIAALLNASGGHVNPAISIGFLLTGQITFVRFALFVLAQCGSSVMAVLILKGLTPPEMHGTMGLILPANGVQPVQALVFEFIITFFLLFGLFSLIDDKRTDVVGPVPLFVGLIVTVNVLFAGNTSGGCMNPARNIGPAIVSGDIQLQWVYWVGPMVGAAAGTLLYDKILSVRAVTDFKLCHCVRSCGHQDNALTNAESVGMLQDMS